MRKRSIMVWLCCMLVMGVIGFANPAEVSACSCAGPPSVQEEMNRKTAIFAGKVTDVSKPSQFSFFRSSNAPVRVTFEVTTVWKGQVSSETEVITAISGASCGYTGFAVNQTYLVSAYGTSDRLETGMCEMTKQLSAAGNELAQLGAGQLPAASNKASGGGYLVPVIASVFALAILIGGTTIVRARKRRR